MAAPVKFGQLWTREATPRANTVFPASSLYISDLEVFAFHLFDGAVAQPMQYDRSIDGGETFPEMRPTTFSIGGDVLGVRAITLPDGTFRVLLLLNASECLAYSDDLLALPVASTWTRVTPPNSVGAPGGIEANGLNVVLEVSPGGPSIGAAYSTDGGATFLASTGLTDTGITAWGFQVFASPSPGVWYLLNRNSGKIYRSADSGASYGPVVHTIPQGDATLPQVSAIIAVSETRMIAVYKGQVSVSDDAGLTWTNKQNLTLPALSPAHVRQGGIGHLARLGVLNGKVIIGGASNWAMAVGGGVQQGAMWRTVDEGETFELVDAVGGGGFTPTTNTMITGFAARNGRGVIDIRENSGPSRVTWVNLVPACFVQPRRRVGTCVDTLTDADIIRARWQAGDRLIINRVIFSIDWDTATQQFTKHVVYTFQDSVKTYGLRPAMRIESRGIRSTVMACGAAGFVGCGLQMLDERAFTLGARFADPPPLLNLEIFYRKHTWEAGDILCVTSAFVPNIVSGRRGIDAEAYEVINVQQQFAPEGKVILTLLDVEALTLPAPPVRFVVEDENDLLIRLRAQSVRLTEGPLGAKRRLAVADFRRGTLPELP